jgi:GNAT superfamily N-acetyltransferase
MAAEIRQAEIPEASRVIEMYGWLFEPPGYTPPGWDPRRAERVLKEAIEDDHSAVMVADDGGGLVGVCTAYLELNSVRFGQRCWVEDLAVDPDRRSEGIGGALLDAAEAWARDGGATHLELDTGLDRTDAQRFYERRNPATKGFSYSWRL